MVDTVANAPYLTRQPHFAEDRMAGSVPVWKNTTGDSAEKMSTATARLAGQEQTLPASAPSLSFGEFLDIVNPLQHIPVVSTIYRDMTGDEISSVARIIGGGLYGGPVGVAASIVNAAVEEHSGHDLATNLMNVSNSSQYQIEDEPRTAGLDKENHNSKAPEQVAEVVDVTRKSEIIRRADDNIFDSMPEKTDVTPVILAEQQTAQPERTYNA